MDISRNGWLALTMALAFAFIVQFFANGAHLLATTDRWWDVVSGWDHQVVREWFSALSGWAALAAGWVTVRGIKAQNRELRRQNDFVIGDMPPEMWAASTIGIDDQNYRGMISVTVTNMNRKPLYIRKVESIDAPDIVLGCHKIGIDGRAQRVQTGFGPNIYVHQEVPGRKVGGHAPVCEMEFLIFVGGKLPALSMSIDDWDQRDITVKLSGNWNGNQGEEVILTQTLTISF